MDDRIKLNSKSSIFHGSKLFPFILSRHFRREYLTDRIETVHFDISFKFISNADQLDMLLQGKIWRD